MSDVVVDRRDQVLWLRLNRPERMNAYDRGTIDELIAAKQKLSDEILSVGAESVLTNLSNEELISIVSLNVSSALEVPQA